MQHSCFKQSLCKTNNGEVLVSCSEDCYKVVFNNLILIHGPKSFHKFYNNVEDCYFTVRKDSDRTTRNIVFSTASNCMILSFSVEEIEELHYLLESALIEIHVHA